KVKAFAAARVKGRLKVHHAAVIKGAGGESRLHHAGAENAGSILLPKVIKKVILTAGVRTEARISAIAQDEEGIKEQAIAILTRHRAVAVPNGIDARHVDQLAVKVKGSRLRRLHGAIDIGVIPMIPTRRGNMHSHIIRARKWEAA